MISKTTKTIQTKPAAGRPTRKKAITKKATRGPAAEAYSMRGLGDSSVYWNIDSFDSVSAQTAIRVTAILACVRFIAQSIASMPLHILRTLPNGRKQLADVPASRVLCKAPNGWMSSYEWLEMMAHHTSLYGNGFSEIVAGERGFCSQLLPLHPSRMAVKRLASGELQYQYMGSQSMGDFTAPRILRQDQVLHFRWMSDNSYTGLMPADLCSTSVSLARKLDTAAGSFWDNSARPDIVLETSESIPPEGIESLRRQWAATYGGVKNRGRTAVLPKKVTAKTIESNSNESAQFMELRSSIVSECARAFGVPSTLIGDAAMARWSNVEQEFLTAQVFCLLPWQRRFEGAIDRSILSTYGDDVYSKLDSRGLLRGDTAARMSTYTTLFNLAAISPNELRDLEDLPLLDDPAADETYLQLGFSTLANAAAAAAPLPTEPDPLPTESTGDLPLSPDVALAATALNGAQVTGLLDVLAKVGIGELDNAAALAIIAAVFPSIDSALAAKIVAGVNPPQITQGA